MEMRGPRSLLALSILVVLSGILSCVLPGAAIHGTSSPSAPPTELQPTSVYTASSVEASTPAAGTPTQPPLSVATPVPFAQPLSAISPDNASQEKQLAQSGKGRIYQALISPDGKLIAVARRSYISPRLAKELQEDGA